MNLALFQVSTGFKSLLGSVITTMVTNVTKIATTLMSKHKCQNSMSNDSPHIWGVFLPKLSIEWTRTLMKTPIW